MKKLLFILMLANLCKVNSQTVLITNIEASGGGSPPPTAYQINEVTIDFDGLKNVPESLEIDFPDLSSTIVPITDFIPRNGFTIRTDDDPPGTPPVYPTPGVPNNELDYLWMGSNADYDVMLSVTKGQLTGLITGNTKRYGIEKTLTDTYNMIDVRLEGYPAQDIFEEEPTDQAFNPSGTSQMVLGDDIKEFVVFNQAYSGGTTQYTPIDILVFYTDQARIDAGGAPGDINDTEDIEALILAGTDHTNAALINSQTNTRVYHLYTVPLLSGFALTGDPRADRERFTVDPIAKYMRNLVGADVVTLMVGDASPDFNLCGIAYVQTYPQCDNLPQTGCGVGEDFDDFAFTIVSQECAILDDTFTHELGHLFGGNHVAIEPPFPGSQLPSGWVNAVTNNGYPEAFAELVDNTFASIMSIDFDTPRRLYFSNPNVSVNGVPTGEVNTKYNAKIIDDLSPTMSNFRQRMDFIFGNGFESQ